MRVLSIDLDYAMGMYSPKFRDFVIEEIHNAHESDEWDDHALSAWQKAKDLSDFDYESLDIDFDAIEYMWTTFARALKTCKNVDFAYDHDAILYRLEKDDATNLEIINIDHHADVINLSEFTCYLDKYPNRDDNFGREMEYEYIKKFDDVMEGNWVTWLNIHGKLKKHITISEDKHNSLEKYWFAEKIPSYRGSYSRKDYTIKNYNFDYIFVCLSPSYIPPKYWKYFKFFIDSYQRLTGNKANIINKKYEITARYRSLNKYLGLPV